MKGKYHQISRLSQFGHVKHDFQPLSHNCLVISQFLMIFNRNLKTHKTPLFKPITRDHVTFIRNIEVPINLNFGGFLYFIQVTSKIVVNRVLFVMENDLVHGLMIKN